MPGVSVYGLPRTDEVREACGAIVEMKEELR